MQRQEFQKFSSSSFAHFLHNYAQRNRNSHCSMENANFITLNKYQYNFVHASGMILIFLPEERKLNAFYTTNERECEKKIMKTA